ncbi:MAG: cell division protein FtsW [Alphaproteobacteria bacterium]|nr:MAG: cell division protein FtsW [Alphaproteobacteria bacterium]
MFTSGHRRTPFNQWFWDIDRRILLIFLMMIFLGIVLNFAATPPIAKRLGLAPFYFAKRHILYMIPALFLMIFGSFLNPVQLRKLCLLALFGSLCLLVFTYFFGHEIKGARRWIQFMGLSVQISEFIKPCFCVISSWMITKQFHDPRFKGIIYSFLMLCFILFFLLLQPDLGMSAVLFSSWLVQIFIGGMPMIYAVVAACAAPVMILFAYLFLPHAAHRMNMFMSGQQNYQVAKALEAVKKGGLFGQGVGEGTIKKYVPDAHADFIFAVAGEEFGIVLCLVIVLLFGMLVYFVMQRIRNNRSFFSVLTISGILTQFSVQSIINISSVLGLIPTKGMTLPFISYGGSSLLALGFSCAILLSLTKRHQEMGEAF